MIGKKKRKKRRSPQTRELFDPTVIAICPCVHQLCSANSNTTWYVRRGIVRHKKKTLKKFNEMQKNEMKKERYKAKKENAWTQSKPERDALGPLCSIHKPDSFSAGAPEFVPGTRQAKFTETTTCATVCVILEGWLSDGMGDWHTNAHRLVCVCVGSSTRSLRRCGPLRCYKMRGWCLTKTAFKNKMK